MFIAPSYSCDGCEIEAEAERAGEKPHWRWDPPPGWIEVTRPLSTGVRHYCANCWGLTNHAESEEETQL